METKETTPGDDVPVEKVIPAARPTRSRKRSMVIFTIVSVLNVGLLVLLWSQLITPAQNSVNSSAAVNDGSAPGPLLGKQVPDFTLAQLAPGQRAVVNLASFKGRPIVLNFWASSCGPCQQEAPLLQGEWRRLQGKGVVFMGVDFQDARSDGMNFLRQYGITYPNALDSGGSVAIHYGVTYTPTTFFINRRGVVVHSIPQELTAQQLQSSVQSIL